MTRISTIWVLQGDTHESVEQMLDAGREGGFQGAGDAGIETQGAGVAARSRAW